MENYSDLHSVCTQVFESVAKIMTVFVLPTLLGRIVFSNVLGEGSKAFGAIKGAVVYFVLITAFPLFVDILFSIPESFLPKYSSIQTLANNSPGISASAIPFTVDRIIEVLLAGLYWISYYLHVFFMLLMCSMAPVVFLVSTLMGVGLGLEIFIGLLIVGSSWPIIWFGFDQVHTVLASAQTDEFGSKCLELLITLFKGLAPVTFASLAIKSPAGQVIAKSTQAAISTGKWTGGQLMRVQSIHSARVSEKFSQSQINGQGSWKTASTRETYSGFSDRLKRASSQYKERRSRNESSRPRNNEA